MIIDFTIENFRSFKAAQTFSLHVEQPGQHLAQHVAWPAGDKIGVLRTAGVYGANASGKSNLLMAFAVLRYMACESGSLKEGHPIPLYEPHRFTAANKSAPIKFEIEFFTHDKTRYVYAIAFDQNNIISEVLDYYPTRQKANLFTRRANDTWETISFGGRYTGGVKRIPFFNNNSYLAKAGENAAAAEIIRKAYKYLDKNMVCILDPATPIQSGFLIRRDLFNNSAMVEKTALFLKLVDTGIAAIQQKKVDNIENSEIIKEMFSGDFREYLENFLKDRFLFGHKTETGELELLDWDLESTGTKRLFNFFTTLSKALEHGQSLLMDEIESSFHPHIAEMIVKLFNDPEINTQHAQLIYSTHNISLMEPNKMRRDQIWFTEKRNGVTQLYSLDHFDKSKVKATSPFPAWYAAGRFDAIPAMDYRAIADLLRPPQAAAPHATHSIEKSITRAGHA